jgi:hypothetical protein
VSLAMRHFGHMRRIAPWGTSRTYPTLPRGRWASGSREDRTPLG